MEIKSLVARAVISATGRGEGRGSGVQGHPQMLCLTENNLDYLSETPPPKTNLKKIKIKRKKEKRK